LSEFGPSDDAFEADRHIGGVYAQLIGDVTPRLSYSAGIRRDDNSAFGTFTTGRASLAYLLGATTRLRVAAGNAFKAPSFYENFASGYVTGNPDLRPEESRSVEAGLETFLADGALRLAVTGYAQRFENIVQYTGSAPSPGAPNYYNVAAADANGLELEASWRTRRDVRAALAYAWTDTRVTQTGFDSSAGASYVKGERLIRRPPHTVSVSLGRAYANGGSWRLVALRVGERDDRDFRTYPTAPTTLPAYVKVDASAVIPTRKAGVQLLLRADNAFGAQYEDVVGFPAPGATFFGGVRIER
jgi:vitamin B12 transporter